MAVQQKMEGLPVIVDLIAVMYDIVEGTQYPREQKAYKCEDCTRSSPVENPAHRTLVRREHDVEAQPSNISSEE